MIEEILKAVNEAEAESDKILKEAYQRGKEIYIEAEAAAEKIKAGAQTWAKLERRKTLSLAEKEAESEEEALLSHARKDCAELKPDIEKPAKLILEKLLKKYDC